MGFVHDKDIQDATLALVEEGEADYEPKDGYDVL